MPQIRFGQRRETVQLALATAMTAATLGFLVAPAHATVTTTYDIKRCRGINLAAESKLQRGSGPNYLIANEEAAIVCPVVKTTSGPTVTSGDKITNVTIPAGLGTLTCSLMVYQVDPNLPGNVSNVIENPGNVNNSGYQFSVVLSSNTSNYWQAGTPNKWRYAQIHCLVSGGTHLYDYTVTEQGTAQAGRRIVSAAACKPAPAATSSYLFYAGTDAWMHGGYVQAQSDENFFSMSCPSQSGAGRFVQIGLGPNVDSGSPNLMGCRPGSGAWKYVNYGGNEFVVRTLNFDPASASTLTCEMKNHPVVGDGKVYSYRTANAAF